MAFCVQEHFDRHNELNHPDGNYIAFYTLYTMERVYCSLYTVQCTLFTLYTCTLYLYIIQYTLYTSPGKKSGWGTLCETCGRVFGVVFQLDVHRAKCANRLSYRCPRSHNKTIRLIWVHKNCRFWYFHNFRCFFSFGFEHDLYRHKLSHDSYLGTSAYSCKDCNKVFSSAFRLQTHVTR